MWHSLRDSLVILPIPLGLEPSVSYKLPNLYHFCNPQGPRNSTLFIQFRRIFRLISKVMLEIDISVILSFITHSFSLLQLRVHCAEALGTPIVGDYKYGWFVHRKWKQMPRVDIEPTTGKPYKLRWPDGLDVQKGSVLSKVPLLHLHCRELILPNIAKFLPVLGSKPENQIRYPNLSSKPDILRFVASMPNHMKISWNLMSSYLVWGECRTALYFGMPKI